MKSRIATRNSIYLTLLLLLLLLVNVITVAIGQDESQLTVANLTGYYVHVFIDGQTFLYVASDRSVSYATSAKPSMLVEVIYSPGQGIRGSLVDTVAVPYQGSTAGCACQEGETFGDCIFEPATGGSVRLEVFADDMNPEG